jgi:tRNA U38,U39,U40 pseudouridine synthase TruA
MSINWQMQLLRSKSNIINGERDKNVELEQRVGAKGIKQGKKLRCIEEIMSCFVSQLLGMHNFINFRRDDPSNVNMGRVLKRARAQRSMQHQ